MTPPSATTGSKGSKPSRSAVTGPHALEWDGRIFGSAGPLRSYVTARGIDWSLFLSKHPAVTGQAALPSVSWNGKAFYDQASLTRALATLKISYRKWANGHPSAAAVLAGRMVAAVEQKAARTIPTPVIIWNNIGFTNAHGLRVYLTQHNRNVDSFLAAHPTIVTKLKLTSVNLDGTTFYTRKALAGWLTSHHTTLAKWSANHPTAAAKLML